MHEFDLLSAVQATEGWLCVVGIKEGAKPYQTLVETREEFDAEVARLLKRQWNIYFGVARYATDENRLKSNVLNLKALWLDIDCGPDKAVPNPKTGKPKGYETQAAGLEALKAFCRTVGMPKPILVSSGRGLHVYWPLTEAIAREVWEPVAARLRTLCNEHGLHVDPAVFEVARILRVPGTLNFKDDPPTEVKVVHGGNPHTLEEIVGVLGIEVPKERMELGAPSRPLSPLAKALLGNSTSRFSKIMRRSLNEEGCNQLADCYNNRETLEEPRWFDALSIAHYCVDRDKAIQRMSEGHPDYTPERAEAKTQHIVGPHTCAVFERNNPGGCEGCPHKGKIKSPILLGKEIIAAPSTSTVEVEGEQFEIPEYPFPYFRGANGGVYRKPVMEEEEAILISEMDIYVVKRMNDPVEGDVVVIRLHTPNDGVREFIAHYSTIAENTEFKKLLAKKGVLVSRKQFELIAEYMIRSAAVSMHENKAEQMRTQFGWADNDSKFIIGDQEVTAEGVYHSPPSPVTSSIAAHMGPVGSYEKWKEVFDLYNLPGHEPHAFAALTAFGAPLLRFLGQKGAIINVIHPRSGTGKTTILHMCNSVWGAPDRLCAVKEDTLNAKIMRLGIMNNLPFTIDEMTNMDAATFSELVYNMSQGRGKDRVKASSNELRANMTSWQTISLSSSNASFYEKLGTKKNSPDGEMMRLMEFKIEQADVLDTEYAKQMFDHQLLNNYGHAGPRYAEFLVNNFEYVRDKTLSVQNKIDRELRLTQRERFWSSLIASNLSSGLIAKEAGILDWDLKRIYGWARSELKTMRKDTEAPVLDVASTIGDYINRHMQNILVVDDKADLRTQKPKLPVLEPRGELLIRYEPDTKRMYLAAKAFKNDCVAYQINYRETVNLLEKSGFLIRTEVKRLSKGMKVASPGVQTLVLDCSRDEFINVEEFVGIEPNAGGGD